MSLPTKNNIPDTRLRVGREQKQSWCTPCKKIPLAQIFNPGGNRRRKRYVINHPYITGCHMCRFRRQLEVLDSQGSEHQSSNVFISTGMPSSMFSTFDTHEPWWNMLGLSTSRPLPNFAWFQREGSANAFKSDKPAVLITCSNNGAESGSIPRRRSEFEQNQGSIELDIVKTWLQICDQKHDTACWIDANGSGAPRNLRLIDVNTRNILALDKTVRYVALSYVWGNANRSSHGHLPNDSSQSDLKGLAEVSQLGQLPDKLPATFEDAMTVCKRLGEQYLWIDLFCIDQSSPDELQGQINQMNRIYQTASFTIVARDSPNAYAGLPGVSVPLKKRAQPTCSTPQGELMATYLRPAIAHSGKSPWQQRGWTLQESLFSHRILSLTNHTVRMICQREYFHDIFVNTNTPRHPVALANRLDWVDDDNSVDFYIRSWDFKTYNALISIYTKRILRYPSDILNACRGALSELKSRTAVQFIYGIPITDAHRALLWTPHHSHSLSRRVGQWPSWSWCGWMGRIGWRRWIVDVPDYEDEASLDDPHVSILNMESKKRRRIADDNSHQDHASRKPLDPATLTFPASEKPQIPAILRVLTLIASCILVKSPKDSHEPTLLTHADQEVGTATKKDLGYHWTLLSPITPSSQDHPAFMNDIANSTGEPDVFAKSDHFIRISKEESEMLERYATSLKNADARDRRGNGKGKAKSKPNASTVQVPAELLMVKHWDLIRDSEEHDAWLADVVGCLIALPVASYDIEGETVDGAADPGSENQEECTTDNGKKRSKMWRVGMAVLERNTFEAFGPNIAERHIV